MSLGGIVVLFVAFLRSAAHGVVEEHATAATTGVTATSLAASFTSHDYRLQMISLPGTFDGFSTTQGVTVEAWLWSTNCFLLEMPLFLYSIRRPLEQEVEAKELGLLMQLVRAREGFTQLPVWWHKGSKLSPSQEIALDDEGGMLVDTCGHWQHVVAIINFSNASYAVYLNGTQIYADVMPALTAGSGQPLAGGVLQLGGDILPRDDEHLHGAQGELMAGDTSSLALDVFRLYNRSLSVEEVAESVWAFDPPASAADALLLDWRFDAPHATVEEDLSGNGNHGRWGASANLDFPELYWHATRQGVVRTLVQRPDSILSSAPVVGASVVTAQMIPGTAVDLALAESSSAGCTLLSLPSVGSVFLVDDNHDDDTLALAEGAAVPDCRLRYFSRRPLFLSSTTNGSDDDENTGILNGPLVNFTFRVESSGLEGLVRVHAARLCEAPEWPAMEMLEVATPFQRRVLLGGACSDGQKVQVEVVGLPQDLLLLSPLQSFDQMDILVEGKDFPAATGEGMAEYISEMELHFTPLLSAPAVVSNDIGAILLLPSSGVHYLNTYLQYRWLSPYANSSVVRRLNIVMEPTGSIIELLPPSCTHDSNSSSNRILNITLDAQVVGNQGHVENGTTSLASGLRFQVSRGPYFGTLYQVTEAGDTGVPLSRFGLQSPTLRYSAVEVPGYNPTWGPAWSSQLSACPECCSAQATCTPTGCARNKVFLSQCEAHPGSFHISGLVDDDDSTLYKSDCVECGRQWFVVGFPEALHIQRVELRLGGMEGHIVSITGAEFYRGNQTLWEPVWRRPDDDDYDGGVTHHHYQARPVPSGGGGLVEFVPELLCRHQPKSMRWLRVEYDTTNATVLPAFASVVAEGSLEPPASVVQNSEGRLVYEALPGVTTAKRDSIEVMASNCDVWSDSATFDMTPAGLLSSDDQGVFGDTQSLTVKMDERAEMWLDLTAAWEHRRPELMAAYAAAVEAAPSDNLTASMVEVQEALTQDDFEIMLEPWGADNGAIRVFDTLSGVELSASESANLGHTTSVSIIHSAPKSHLLHFRASLGGVTYRLEVEVTSRCPSAASIFECSEGPQECSKVPCDRYPEECAAVEEGGSSIVYDPITYKCTLHRNAEVSTTTTAASRNSLQVTLTVALIGLCLLTLTGLTLLWYKRRAILRRLGGGPPGRGEMVTLVTTDIHGSTTLWDSYPNEVAHDIALHHECLRGSLKSCNGYEIATEGDSFKCAFATPEDAICWSILAQLDLLCARWNDKLEDGGHAALLDRADWANCEAEPTVGRNAQEILANLTATDGMSRTRKALAAGVLMKPQFDPKAIADSDFCRQWRVSKGETERCAVYGPDALKLPIFRGLRVRIGIHTGMADEVEINPITRRVMYGGQVAKIAKLVSDAPCGGQIVMSGDTLAHVCSIQDLMQRVALMCAGWRHGEAATDPHTPAAMTVMSLGSHLLSGLPKLESQGSEMTVGSIAAVDDIVASNEQVHDIGGADEELTTTSEGDSSKGGGAALVRLKSKKRPTLTAMGVPEMDQSCVLPPCLGGHGGIIDDDFMAAVNDSDDGDGGSSSSSSSSHTDSSSSDDDDEEKTTPLIVDTAERGFIAKSRHLSAKDRPSISHIPHDVAEAQRQAAAELRESHELIMVLPWPLKARAEYYPPVSSFKPLSPAWDAAPAATGVTILFAFLEGTSQLKEMEPKEAASAALWQLQAVVRSQLVLFRGYDVEVEEGSFVCAFHSALDAVHFSASVQHALMAVRWSSAILAETWAAEHRTASNELSFRGLRLSIGMCTGDAMRVQPCVRTGKMEYFGPIMNHAARTAVAAHGGQVLLHESSWNQVVAASANGTEPKDVVFRNMGAHSLKGITRKVHIIQAIPTALTSRSFPQIKTKRTGPVQLQQQRPSSLPPPLQLAELDAYLAGVGGVTHQHGPQQKQSSPARQVSSGVAKLSEMRVGASLKGATDFMIAAAPFVRLRGVCRRVLGMQQRATRIQDRRPSLMAIVADQALQQARHDLTDSDRSIQSHGAEYSERSVEIAGIGPPRSVWSEMEAK